MGNRAVICVDSAPTSAGIYVHYNGGAPSVCAFVEAARLLQVRRPDCDQTYFMSRLGQIIGNYFGGSTSIGYGLVGNMDSSDNGVYVIESFQMISNNFNKFDVARMADPQVLCDTLLRNYDHFRKTYSDQSSPSADAQRFVAILRAKIQNTVSLE